MLIRKGLLNITLDCAFTEMNCAFGVSGVPFTLLTYVDKMAGIPGSQHVLVIVDADLVNAGFGVLDDFQKSFAVVFRWGYFHKIHKLIRR